MGAPGGGGGPKPPGEKKPAGEDEVEIVKTLFRVFEKWRKAAGEDKEKGDMIQQFSDLLQKYNDKFVKADGAGSPSKEAPQPTAMEGQGPAPDAGGGGMETQPVPA
jgi:hypothetical protein